VLGLRGRSDWRRLRGGLWGVSGLLLSRASTPEHYDLPLAREGFEDGNLDLAVLRPDNQRRNLSQSHALHIGPIYTNKNVANLKEARNLGGSTPSNYILHTELWLRQP
jgi:hypothetical protein